MMSRRALLPLLLLAWPLLAGAQDSAREWLERMIRATESLDYQGTFVYIQGQNVDVMTLFHSNHGGVERQRMKSLNGTLREVLAHDDEVICLLPEENLAFRISKYERSPFPISFPRDLDSLTDSYEFRLGQRERVVNRLTQIVRVEPLDAMRYGLRLWLDTATGLVLRSALVDQEGEVLEQLIFTDFRQQERIDPMLLESSFSGKPKNWLVPSAHESADEGQRNWELTDLPAGFERVLYQWHGAAAREQPVGQMVFSDGLATVSVFVEPLDGEPLLEGASHMESMNAHGAVLDRSYQVIAVGEVPPETVARIAGSIRLTDAAE